MTLTAPASRIPRYVALVNVRHTAAAIFCRRLAAYQLRTQDPRTRP